MAGRTWKSVIPEIASQIRERLLSLGGEERTVSAPHETWAIRFSDSVFTSFKNGTLYSTPSNQQDPAVEDIWNFVDQLAGSIFVKPTRDFLIGLDETGKGELIGHTHLAGVLIPSGLFNYLEKLISTADTKKSHEFNYWDGIFKEIATYTGQGLAFREEKIPPWHVDKYNLNKIMDVVYQRILATFLREIDMSSCRIVIDDYGVGFTLKRFLGFLEKRGAEIIVAQKSDDQFLEARVASIIAKRQREAVLKAINENPEFKVSGLSVGSGNAGNRQTLEWLKSWKQSGKPWPWFIKRSYSTIRELDGLKTAATKSAPPIRETLLAEDFRRGLDEGRLDVRALSVVCPKCGTTSKAILLTGSASGFEARCPSCKKVVDGLSFTLRYYCGFVVPDSNIITGGLLGKDLEKSRFFEDFTIVLPSIVRYECDTAGGKREFERLGRFASIGRIKIKETQNFEPEKFKGLTTQERDDLVMEACRIENAILLSADNQVKALAVARSLFTLSVL